MDFDIDSFLNETFKKVDKNDKKKISQAKPNDPKNTLKINKEDSKIKAKDNNIKTEIVSQNKKVINSFNEVFI